VSFQLNRVGIEEQEDDPIVSNSDLEPFSRMIIGLTLNGTPKILLDGMITHHEVNYTDAGELLFTVTGEDVSVMMDLKEESVLHPAQAEHIIATKLIATYARYGLTPDVKPPPTIETPLITDRIPSQQETDFAYLRRMAERFGYVFYIQPGPVSGVNTAYWGPVRSTGVPLPALTVDMGSFTNVSSANVRLDALSATIVEGKVQDRKTNQIQPINITKGNRSPLAKTNVLQLHSKSRTTQFRGTGHSASRAKSIAQATVENSLDRSVALTGTLDTFIYNDILLVGKSIAVRGLGATHDGAYLIHQVSHSIQGNHYIQRFTLHRDGIGSQGLTVRI
jgi:phage protein D